MKLSSTIAFIKNSTVVAVTTLALTLGANRLVAQTEKLANTKTLSLSPALPSIEDQLDSIVLSAFGSEYSGVALDKNGAVSSTWDSGLDLEWPLAPIHSMQQVAELFPPAAESTSLFLNFDGDPENRISPFVSTTGNRDRDIQQIMFVVAQIFAPFDVEVIRINGPGEYLAFGGCTTIFIGDNSSNSTILEGKNYTTINRTRAVADADYPCPNRNIWHQPNSDQYNLGYVDPVSSTQVNGVEVSWDSWSNQSIGQTICHEAGHTFGLAHVLTKGQGTDIMSYDSSNRYFELQGFELTSLNAVPGGPAEPNEGLEASWWYYIFEGNGVVSLGQNGLTWQSSYQVLAATLGIRYSSSDIANIADSGTVDPIYIDAQSHQMHKDQIWVSHIDRKGDFDVYDFTAVENEPIQIEVERTSGFVDPIIMVFNDSGQQLIAYDDDSGHLYNSKLTFSGVKGTQYKLVVGAQDGKTTGGYVIRVDRGSYQFVPEFQPDADLGLTKK